MHTFAITLDLMGENRVRNAPVKLRIDSLTPIVSGSEYRILDNVYDLTTIAVVVIVRFAHQHQIEWIHFVHQYGCQQR